MIYAVILIDMEAPVDLTKSFASMKAKVYKWRNEVYEVPPKHVYFVSYKGTTNELSNNLGFAKNKGGIDGVVIPLNDYSGYGDNDLWEWLKGQAGDE